MSLQQPTNWQVYEPDDIYEFLNTDKEIKINDTIEYISYNQEGYKKFAVILNDKNEKTLKLIACYDDYTV